ncbi:hypothetical protein LNQ81_14075 [Myroides sp. M-43]|uniref:hypothetical protein n=1 Tax=Myroides oncorhynchi TaxID=2893756 RepID=UPI001E5DDD80|nr:hypothetical protein [Myroides oncorhynchi]MCC9043803.1 hypothetical protein [Myroides oncorhynchi]
MKKIAMLFAFVASSLLIAGCEGSTGPQGPPGQTMYPFVEDIRVSFDTNLNSFSQTYTHKNNPKVKVYDGDVVLVFVMDGNTKDGLPIWAPLPKRFFVDVKEGEVKIEKELEYSYTFSRYDVEIDAKANAALGNFNGDGKDHPGFLKNMIFRLVYIPGNDPVVSTKSVKTNNDTKKSGNTTLSYEEAVRKYNLEDVKVVKNY